MAKKIHHYRPQRTAPESLEAILVAREHVLHEILNRLEQWKPGASRQHFLLIGPRGIGKTHVISLIAHRISLDPRLSNTWFPILFPEESYGIAKISDFLLEALRVLANETGDEDISEVYREVRYNDDDARVTDLVLDVFRKIHKSKGTGFLFLIENVNRILEQQIKDKSQVRLLRKILTEEEWLVTVCTSPTYLDAVTKEDEPLFEFFQVRFLAELSQKEQLEMLEKLAAHEDNKAFQAYMQKYRSRLLALYHFTGGNPRLTIMLYDLVSYQAITDVQAELDGLLDKITPFYQDRMKDIGEQEGKLVERMALLAEGCTPSELAMEARMEPKTVRTVLGRLEKAGYVRREQRRQKKTVYIIPERLFRIWHQMNHSRAGRGLISYLLEFFSTWHQTKEERDEVWHEILKKMEKASDGDDDYNDDLNGYMNYLIAVSEGSERIEREFDLLRKLTIPKGEDAIEKELKRLDSLYGTDFNYLIYEGIFCVEELYQPEKALCAFRKASDLRPNDIISLYNQTVVLDTLRRWDESTSVCKKIVNLMIGWVGVPLNSFETLDALLNVLCDEPNSYTAEIAAQIIVKFRNDKIVDRIISILKQTKEDWIRQFCITILGLLNTQQAIHLFLSYLKDSKANIRGSAATALGKIGSEKAVEPLIKMLHDEDIINRGSAVTALGRIGSKKSVESLIQALQDEASNVRGSAASALGRIGSEKAIEPLMQVLQDEDNNVRGSAATALGRIGSEKSVEPLIQALQDEANIVRGSAATALGRIGSERAAEPLIKMLHDEDGINRGSAATALGRIGSEKAVEPLMKSLSDKGRNVRVSTSIALYRIATEKQISHLSKVIGKIFKHLSEREQGLIPSVVRQLLRNAYRSADLKVIITALDSAKKYLELDDFFYLPYEIALEYIKSNYEPAIIDRQHPEMRDAVQLLVDIFQKGEKEKDTNTSQ